MIKRLVLATLTILFLSACSAPDATQPATVVATTLSEAINEGIRLPAADAFLPIIIGEESMLALPPGFDVQGHRGARGLKPENTLPAFEQALDLGVSTLELDLHFTADQVVVVWHDDTVSPDKCHLPDPGANPPPNPDDPTVPPAALRIAMLTAAQLAQYQCGRNPDSVRFPFQNAGPTVLAGSDYGIPTLDALFDFAERYSESPRKADELRQNAATVQFNIETKRKANDPGAIGDDFDGVNPGAFEIAIVDLIEQRALTERVILQSFDHRSLWATHTLNPEIRLAALTFRGQDLAEYAAQGAVIWSPNYEDVTPARLDQARTLGLKVIPWTVNETDTMKKLIEAGVDGIITDRPDLLLGAQ